MVIVEVMLVVAKGLSVVTAEVVVVRVMVMVLGASSVDGDFCCCGGSGGSVVRPVITGTSTVTTHYPPDSISPPTLALSRLWFSAVSSFDVCVC